jgi:hypothetical protein
MAQDAPALIYDSFDGLREGITDRALRDGWHDSGFAIHGEGHKE